MAMQQRSAPLPDFDRSPWVQELEGRFEQLRSLGPGWDGYLGQPIAPDVVQFTAELVAALYVRGVPAPHVVPGSDGSLQIEWHMNQYDLEINVQGPHRVVAALCDLQDSSNDQEAEIGTADFEQLFKWVAALKEERALGLGVEI